MCHQEQVGVSPNLRGPLFQECPSPWVLPPHIVGSYLHYNKGDTYWNDAIFYPNILILGSKSTEHIRTKYVGLSMHLSNLIF
jgi:hypothetical protein